ncbi:antitoxin HipB [Lentilactobacillus sunkii]|uniref:Antitoxin HipB n=1 Tax=Lentilactobacillus sunkii TaxID=481719 RepID=A0A1E7XEE3_9LACO|nr:antitoxin HipB [Lentilactobacillus sunkii]
MKKHLKNTIPVDDLIDEQMRDLEFAIGFTEEYNKLSVAVEVFKAREAAGITQQELADKAGIPQTTVARIERGSNTSIETLTKIACALGKKVTISIN